MSVRHDLRRSPIKVLSQSGTGWTVPADTTEDTLVTYTLPGGTMGANDAIEVHTTWTMTSSANSKTMKIKFGGTTMLSNALTTSAQFQALTRIANRNATNSQISVGGNASSGLGGGSSAAVTVNVDTTSDVTVLITGQKASSGETLKLEAYSIRLVRG